MFKKCRKIISKDTRRLISFKKKKWVNFTKNIDKNDKKYGEYFTFFVAFITSIFIRFFVVAVSAKFSYSSGKMLIDFILQDFLIFLLSFLSIWIVLSYILKCKPSKLKYLMILATPLVVLPPLIDFVATKGGGYWSFYINESLRGLYPIYVTFFDNLPSAIEYFGTRIMVFFAVFMIALYVAYVIFAKSRSFVKSVILFFITAIIMYSIFFFYASFPSWFSFFYFSIFEHKSIMSVSLADISSLFITPHEIFHANPFNISNALLKKLNMIYALLVIPLIFLKEKRDKNISISVNIFKKINIKNVYSKLLDILLIIYTPVFFALFGFYDNKPFQELLFSSIYMICVTILFILFSLFFSSSNKHLKIILGILIGIISFVVGYKVLFLFIVLLFGLYSLRFINIDSKDATIIFSSIITAFVFYLIFLPEQKLSIFPWYLLLYTLITIFFANFVKKNIKNIKNKNISLNMRILDLIVGISMIINILISKIYLSINVLLVLFMVLAINVFFVKKDSFYFSVMNIFIILMLIFSIFSAGILASS